MSNDAARNPAYNAIVGAASADRPHRVWGYPSVPGLLLSVTVYLLINTAWATPYRALSGIG